MTAQDELDPKLLVQPIEPGSEIPSGLDAAGLFLLNFSPVLRDDLWDDYGNKELEQARRLRRLAARVVAIADALEQLGYEMKAYPSPEDYDFNEYKMSWEELCQEMNSTFTNGYAQLGELVDDFAEAARGDFMD